MQLSRRGALARYKQVGLFELKVISHTFISMLVRLSRVGQTVGAVRQSYRGLYTIASVDYAKLLLKKFMFQVHPDFFTNYKSFQAINATNLGALQSIIDTNGSSSEYKDMKSLKFYVKPTSDDSAPKRVKLSLNRIEKSIIEILETIGVDVPPIPESVQQKQKLTYSTTVLASPEQVAEFLDSMHERKDLVQWREERMKVLKEQEKMLLELTGAAGIQYRNSWSAQNNAVMLSRLIGLITHHKDTIPTPWTGMSIVFCKEEDEFRINYLDHTILLNPTDVPVQLLAVLTAIDPRAIEEVKAHATKFDILHDKFESMVSNVLLEGLKQESVRLDAPVQQVTVQVKRGFTCSPTNYYYFLHMMNQRLQVFEPSSASLLSGGNMPFAESRVESSSQQQRVQIRPMEVVVTIEDSHGTKMLQNGSFRIDARADADAVRHVLSAGCSSLAERMQSYFCVQEDIVRLTARLKDTLNIHDIQPGVGVSDVQFVACLQRMELYAEEQGRPRASLRQLAGFRVLVGHYLGMADDGACIIPWDIVLPLDNED